MRTSRALSETGVEDLNDVRFRYDINLMKVALTWLPTMQVPARLDKAGLRYLRH